MNHMKLFADEVYVEKKQPNYRLVNIKKIYHNNLIYNNNL